MMMIYEYGLARIIYCFLSLPCINNGQAGQEQEGRVQRVKIFAYSPIDQLWREMIMGLAQCVSLVFGRSDVRKLMVKMILEVLYFATAISVVSEVE